MERKEYIPHTSSTFKKLMDNFALDENYLQPSQEYPLNSKLIESWKNKNILKYPNFTNILSRNGGAAIKHISFTNFYAALMDSWKKFVKRFAPQPYILILPDMECHSTLWVTELLLKHPDGMRTYMPTDVFSSDLDAKKNYRDKISMFLYVDDASYSGSQLSLEASEAMAGITVVILVPFISSTAMKRIENSFTSYKSVPVIINSQFMPTLREVAEEMKISPEGHDLDKILTYFDHKVADNLSTFPQDIRAMITECVEHADDTDLECPMPPYRKSPSCLRHELKK